MPARDRVASERGRGRETRWGSSETGSREAVQAGRKDEFGMYLDSRACSLPFAGVLYSVSPRTGEAAPAKRTGSQGGNGRPRPSPHDAQDADAEA